MLETFEVGPCDSARQMGFRIGQRFTHLIRNRVAGDLILQEKLLPFARTPLAQPLIHSISSANKRQFPRYWEEMEGTAEGSGVSTLELLLLNFRKEIMPFVAASPTDICNDDCSDVLLASPDVALVAHNEDANVALVGHTYLVKAKLSSGLSFTAYTYAGELPTCAFGFNSHGLAFTMNSVPPTVKEIEKAGMGRNFISRDLLEATNLDDALQKLRRYNVSAGHSYNLVDFDRRRVINVETASGNRFSAREIGPEPFFHANMYVHLHVDQVHDQSSLRRQKRAALLPAASARDMLSLLGDSADDEYPIYMTGPTLYTICTALIDLDKRTLSIIQGNPKDRKVSHVFDIPA
ncbi:uncharacterized protein LOC144703361 [Wolffia australiana]